MIICGATVDRLFWKLRRLGGAFSASKLGILFDITARNDQDARWKSRYRANKSAKGDFNDNCGESSSNSASSHARRIIDQNYDRWLTSLEENLARFVHYIPHAAGHVVHMSIIVHTQN